MDFKKFSISGQKRATYDSVLLTNISGTVSETNGDFGRQSQFFLLRTFNSDVELPLKFCNGSGTHKIEVCRYQKVEKFEDMFIQNTSVLRTDGYGERISRFACRRVTVVKLQ